ncbi:transporter substrate-binding domain-containing protein (plasmid) [Skermanella rosea]|uniref:substrate-binding periplasmic protein n=1 Tax=Skermanella rosea TaxID=1817965 RepID=UPI001932DFCC|nr:transporter substrate-binding domain-containing protein [Skermanella rosea]UEM07879.1 transporter substrate-binding domain-containing protein [Skermanella rosea]
MTARRILPAAVCLGLAVTGAASAGTLDDMRRAGRFAICAAPDALPFSSREPGPPGFQLELGEQIARGLGLDFEVTWIKSKEYAGRTGCDAFMSAASLPEDAAERAEAGTAPASRRFPRLLTRPYLPVRFVLVAPVSRDDIRELDDLRTGHVAVPSGSWAHYVLNERGIPVRVRFTTDAEILAAVAAGEVDAGVVSLPGLGWYRTRTGDRAIDAVKGVTVDPSLDYEAAIALRRSDLATVRAVESVLDRLEADGSLARILGKYGLDAAAGTAAQP